MLNSNGKKLIKFAMENELKITNNFFRCTVIQKYAWAARGFCN